MEWLLVLLIAGGGGFATKRWIAHRDRRRTLQDELEGVRGLADEDVTCLGEQLQRLGGEVEGQVLDQEIRDTYQTALDAYESAKRAVPRIQRTDEISKITDTLSTGRYAVACVQAKVAGRPEPELRVPCFFNPQHGPSVANVVWTPPGRGTRTVPACAQDAARVANQERPEVRKAKIGSRTVPYWEAGSAFAPYGEGYFATAGLMLWAFQPPALPALGAGYGGDMGGGGSDGGGMDLGGMDLGGMDLGGGDGGAGGL
jgi:hypothetical protein